MDRYDAGGDHERSRLTWTLRPFLEHLQREGKNADAVLRSTSVAPCFHGSNKLKQRHIAQIPCCRHLIRQRNSENDLRYRGCRHQSCDVRAGEEPVCVSSAGDML